MTYSISAFCEKTQMVGVAITTSSIAVGSRCPWVRASAGAVSTQNITDPTIGTEILDLMSQGSSAENALSVVMNDRPNASYRQVAAIDRNGNTAHFEGSDILGIHSVSNGSNCIAAGNLLSNQIVTDEMVKSFENTHELPLAERLLRSLENGLNAGGEEGPEHSATLLVAHKYSWPLVDLRVDWSETPMSDLRDLWHLYQPQMHDYVTRAMNPGAAPSYGVPGDN